MPNRTNPDNIEIVKAEGFEFSGRYLVLLNGVRIGAIDRLTSWSGRARTFQPLTRGLVRIGEPAKTRAAAAATVLIAHERASGQHRDQRGARLAQRMSRRRCPAARRAPSRCPAWCRADHAGHIEFDAEIGFTLHSSDPARIELAPTDGGAPAGRVAIVGIDQVEYPDGRREPATITLGGDDLEPVTVEDARRVAGALLRAAALAEGPILAVTR